MNWTGIIERLHIMAQKEREHLEFLEKKVAPANMLAESIKLINHLETRIEWYENYCKERNLI